MNNAADKQRKVLGKGLSALLNRTITQPEYPNTPTHHNQAPITRLAVDDILANPLQPRTQFQPAKLEELAQSIRTNGIIQPIIVRRKNEGYEIVAGERRWRAAKLAGLNEVPVVIQDFADHQLLEVALIENIQREDLNVLEAAHAFDRLSRELGLTQEEIGRRTGKDRATIANTIRLLKLPIQVQSLITENKLSMGQARPLLALPTDDAQIDLANKAAATGMSAREVERLVKNFTTAKQPTQEKLDYPQDPNVKAAIQELERTLGTRVKILEQGGQRGRIEIEYYSQEDLNRIYSMIVGDASEK